MNSQMLRDLTKRIDKYKTMRMKCFDLIQSPSTKKPIRNLEDIKPSFFKIFKNKKSKYALDRKLINISIRSITDTHPRQR